MKMEPTLINTDVLVIGGGIAGAFAALKAKEGGSNVLLVDKGRVGRTGCSVFTAGTMAVSIPGEDDMDQAFKVSLDRTHYMLNQKRLKQHIQDIYPLILEMDKYGVPFKKDTQGKFVRAGRGGPVKFRSMDIMEAMRKVLLARGIKLLSRICITELIADSGRVQGAVGFDIEKGDFIVFLSRATILASGGCRYKGLAPGHRNCTGDGIAMAYRAGAVMGGDDSENVSSIFVSSCEIGPGMNDFVKKGAKFFNRKGEELVEKYSTLLGKMVDIHTLMPVFLLEARMGNKPVTMSLNHLSTEQVEDLRYSLPLATRTFERAGILQGDKFVREMECQLTSPKGSLGLMVKEDFMASLEGLYACGECLAMPCMGGSLSHSATSGAAAGRAAASHVSNISTPHPDNKKIEELKEMTYGPFKRKDGMEPDQVILALQEVIIPYNVLLLKEGSRLKKALEMMEDIKENQVSYISAYDPHYLTVAHEAANMALQAECHLKSALLREESRFALREDFPFIDDESWLKWVLVKKDKKDPAFSTSDIPFTYLKPERKKHLNPLWQLLMEKGIVKVERERVTWT